jgi:hypothetical protein
MGLGLKQRVRDFLTDAERRIGRVGSQGATAGDFVFRRFGKIMHEGVGPAIFHEQVLSTMIDDNGFHADASLIGAGHGLL